MSGVALLYMEPKPFALQSASGANGNGTPAALNGKYGVLTMQVVPSTDPAWNGILNFEATQNGSDYQAIVGCNEATGVETTTTTAAGIFEFKVSNITSIRARQSDHVAGTVTVTATATAGVSNVSGAKMDGANATIGAKANTAITDSTTTNTLMSFVKGLVKILADVWVSGSHWLKVAIVTEIPAGTKVIGGVQIDQTIPGTTNGVQLTASTAIAGKFGIDQTTPGTTNLVQVGGTLPAFAATPTVDTELPAAAALGDGKAVPTTPMVGAVPMLYNGTTVDAERGNTEVTLLISAARTSQTGSSDQTNCNGRGVAVFLNVTALVDTPSINVCIQTKDPVSGGYTNAFVGPAVTGTTSTPTVYYYYPAIGSAAGKETFPLVRTWRVTVLHADGDSITYSVGACVIV